MQLALDIRRFDWRQQWQSVLHGVGASNELPGLVEELGATRVMIVTTSSIVREREVLGNVKDVLGARFVGCFDGCRQYTPRSTVVESLRIARDLAADLLVSLGGGSVVDTAKATVLGLAEGLSEAPEFDAYRGSGENACRLSSPTLPVVALPTTLSGAEYTPMIAITNEETGEREPFQNPSVAPRMVILDPALTSATPDALWLTTGVKILSDAFEQYANGLAGPVMEPLLLRSIEWLYHHLEPSVKGSRESRLACQIASWLTLFGTFSTGTKVGIGAAIRHQLGMLHGLRHGEATCGILARVVGHSSPDDPAMYVALCRALGIPDSDESVDGSAIAARFDVLLASLGLPRKLSDLGIREEQLDRLAERAAGDFAARSRSARVWSSQEVRSLLAESL